MPLGQEFNDTNSAVHQPPTQDPSSFGKPDMGGGSDIGGTANLRADFKATGPTVEAAAKPGPSKAALQGDSFTDSTV